MWMDAYVDEILIREQMREARESAARRYAITGSARAARRPTGRLARLFEAVARRLNRHARPRRSKGPGASGVVPSSAFQAEARPCWPRFALDVAVWP